MSQKELNRYDIIKRLIHKEINGPKAANLLKLSTRQIRRLKAKTKESGAAGLIHGNRGKQSNHKIPETNKEKMVALLHKHYYDFGPTLAQEKLTEIHHIIHDPKTIRQIMIDEKLWQPKAKRQKSEHRQWRQRKSNFGEMVQFDGSYEYWFEDRNDKCCLLASVDDATGKIIKAKFAQDEGVFPVFGFWLEYLKKQGKPHFVYLDKFSTYKMTQKVAQDNHDTKTQFQRAMAELQIEPIFANSPQAKGRVERLFGTLQDRLIKELRLNNISSIKAANEFLEKTFIPIFNAKFSVEPKSKANLHTPLTQKERKQLASIFSRQILRTVQNDFTISFKNHWYQLTKEQPATICKKDKVIVEEHLDGQVMIRLRSKHLNYQVLPVRPKKQSQPWVLAATLKTPALMENAKATN
jgi:hypothetical protein